MTHEPHIFVSIAHMAGLFIGFGALIAFSLEQRAGTQNSILMVIILGLAVMLASLLPSAIMGYGLDDTQLWRWSSEGFLSIIWIAMTGFFLSRITRVGSKPISRPTPS